MTRRSTATGAAPGRPSRRAIALSLLVALSAATGAASASAPALALARVVLRGAAVHTSLTTSPSGHLHLAIRVGRRTEFDGAVRSPVCGSSCALTPLRPRRSSLWALEIGGRRPAVLLGLFSGGAHCCFSDQLYVQARGRFVRHELNLLDDQPVLESVAPGIEALRGADARLAEGFFTDFAHSGAPFAEWSLAPSGFVSITGSFPQRLTRDAAMWWKRFQATPDNGVGYIAAWAADEDGLGHSALVARTLAAEARAGRLRSSLSGPGHSGASFVAALQKALRALGYLMA